MPFSFVMEMACSTSLPSGPMLNTAMSSPFCSKRPFPKGNACMGQRQSFNTPLPLGYLMTKGPMLGCCAVNIRLRSSCSSMGEEIIILGTALRLVMSKAP